MSTMSTTSRKYFSSRCFLCLSEYARYGENGDMKNARIWRTLRENITVDLIDLLIQCLLSTVPLEWVVRLGPQEMQDGRPLEGW